MPQDRTSIQSIAGAAPRGFDATLARTTLFSALLAAARRHTRGKVIVEDHEGETLTYGRLILASLVLGGRLARRTRRGEVVGVLLPNSIGILATLFGLNAFGRVPALLNFSAGARSLRSALVTGVIHSVVTSRRFVAAAKLEPLVAELAGTEVAPGSRCEIVYLEDVRAAIGASDKVTGAVRARTAAVFHKAYALGPDQPGVILFTSGTEGAPKGVVLSNANLVANARQILAHADGVLSPSDTVMNPLPLFHSFGLTAATLMPLLGGMKVVLYPSPLHYREVPRLVGRTKATILFATDTFLQGYARSAEPADLASVRYVIAGAERVKEETRAAWAKFGTTVLEGYGATECAPVLCCNLPDAHRPGSVGRLLPAIERRIDPVEGIDGGGRLYVRGPNVMAGYLLPDRPGVLQPSKGPWYDTGDIVDIDADGFVSIKGRVKRFAKIGGEMISLAAVEGLASSLWPEFNHVVLDVPDPRKGERLVLVTDCAEAEPEALRARARAEGLPELGVPRSVLFVPQIPVLASGKVDFVATRELVLQAQATGR